MKNTLLQTLTDMPTVKLASVFPCQEVLYFKPWMKIDKLEQQVVQEKKWITKEANTLKTAWSEKIQTFVSIYVMKEDLHTSE